jgi:hydrogenase expression/formation protein HypC
MCLAIPARVISIEDDMATINLEGTRRRVSLLLQDEVEVGDYVIVHAGFVIHKIDEAEAEASLRLLREAGARVEGGDPD